jgi:hypothetical protein
MSEPRRLGKCPVCRWARPLTKADRLRKHRRERTNLLGAVVDEGYFRVHCEGSGRVPSEIRIFGTDRTIRIDPAAPEGEQDHA